MTDLSEQITHAQTLYDSLDHESDAPWYVDCRKCLAAQIIERLHEARRREQDDPILAMRREREDCTAHRKPHDIAATSTPEPVTLS